jgi:hypothetical protein
MIALTDRQLSAIMDAARHVQHPLRSDFLHAVAAALEGTDFGDDDLDRAIRVALQRITAVAREA